MYFIKHKSDVLENLKDFNNIVKNKFGHNIKIIRADNGKEYINHHVMNYLSKQGIIMKNTASYTPQQNGKTKRENRTIIESDRTMLQAKGLPIRLWAEAINTAVYILNRVSIKAGMNMTPYEVWNYRKPDLSHIRIFGSSVFVHIHKQFRHKMDKKAKKLILVGYQCESSNYRLWDSVTNKIIISRDVIFNEDVKPPVSTSASISQGVCLSRDEKEAEEATSESNSNKLEDNSSEKKSAEIESGSDSDAVYATPEKQLPEKHLRDRVLLRPPKRYELNLTQYNAPKTYREAISGRDSALWKEAIEEELQAHKTNKTWILMPRPINQTIIDSKWIFRIKQDPEGKITRYKARLCARGFKQELELTLKKLLLQWHAMILYESYLA